MELLKTADKYAGNILDAMEVPVRGLLGWEQGIFPPERNRGR